MWAGVVDSLAVLKFSTSPSTLGEWVIVRSIIIAIIEQGVISLIIKNGKNFILSLFVSVPIGLDDPFSCKNNR